MNLRDSYQPQIKRRYNVFLICPASHPLPLRTSGRLTVQNYNFFPNQTKKFAFACIGGKGNQDISTIRLVEYKESAQGIILLNGTIIVSLLFYFVFICQPLQQGLYTWYILGYHIPHGLWNNIVIVMH